MKNKAFSRANSRWAVALLAVLALGVAGVVHAQQATSPRAARKGRPSGDIQRFQPRPALPVSAATPAASEAPTAAEPARATQATTTGAPERSVSAARLSAPGAAMTSSGSTVVTSTTIIHFTPADPGGNAQEGYCWVSSIAVPRADAWRCMVGNSIHDPAFALPGGEFVVCDANPALGKPGFKVKLTKPLPQPDFRPSQDNRGWLLQLADGMVCQRRSGGAVPPADGKIVTYYCPDGRVILGEPNTADKVWTVERAGMERQGEQFVAVKPETVRVKTVWK